MPARKISPHANDENPAAHESYERFRSLIENAADLISVIDPTGRVMYQSPSSLRVLGYAPAEVVGRDIAELVHPDDLPVVRASLAACLADPTAVPTLKLRARHKDGSWRWLDAQGSNQMDQPGVRGVVANLRDITDRVLAEEALRESEMRFRQVVENIASVFWVSDLAGNLLYVSPAYEAVWGRPTADIYANPGIWFEGVHPDDREVVGAQREIADERGVDTEHRIVRPDGAVRWLHTRVFPVRDAEGRIYRVTGIAEDITDRKEAEREREAQQELLETILDHIPVMIGLFDQGGRFTWANREWQRVLGWTPEELGGENILEYCYPDPDLRATVARHMQAPEQPWADFGTRVRDGRTIETSWANIPLSDGTSIGIGQDVTERKALEQQLLQAQKMESIGRLAGGIAHDFNNLLTVILGSAEMAAAEIPADAPVQRMLHNVQSAAARAADLTRQLLAFARKQVIVPRVVSLSAVLTDLAGMLRRLVGEHITVQCAVAPDTGAVFVDPGQLEQVLMNLAVNARDAMPSGGTLRIETDGVCLEREIAHRGVTIPPGRYVRLRVSDSGVGMAEEVRRRVFEPFFTTKPVGTGTGLGLAMCYGIIKQSGGYVWVDSEPGKGAAFEIHLPAVDEPEQAVRADEPRGRRHGHETVLLVEDQALVRVVSVTALRAQGYTVIEATSGEEALRLAGQRVDIDLVVTDMIMPGMTGPEMVARFRAAQPDVRVLYMSGYAPDQAPTGVSAAGEEFIQKPFKPSELASRIRELLDEG